MELPIGQTTKMMREWNGAVKNSEEPEPDWKKYDARVIKSCDDYFMAQQLLKKALNCNTSDLQSEEEEEEIRPKRRPKPMCCEKEPCLPCRHR
ncbi:hypothetical protein PO909_030026 [Leuciscus waleckii]